MTSLRAPHSETGGGQPTTLLLLSGGLDSVLALWLHVERGEPIRTHHVRLSNWEGRQPAEAAAVGRVLDWMRSHGYGHLIHHSESAFDYGDLRYVVRDHNIWGLVAGIVLADPKRAGSITKVVRTFHRDSVVGGAASSHGRRAAEAWDQPIQRLARNPITYTFPLAEMTKADIVRALPSDLLALCWWCRRPRAGQPCHQCHTCRQVDAALAGEPWVPLDERGTASEPPQPVPSRPAGNASRQAWADYATAVGVDVPDDATRNQIRDLVGR